MPQFDFYTFSFQIFLVILSFLVFYYFNTFYTLTQLALVIKMRAFLAKYSFISGDNKSVVDKNSNFSYTAIMRRAFKASGFMK